MPYSAHLSHEDDFYDIYSSVKGLCLPWMGESSGVGPAPWVCEYLNIPTPSNWPYGEGLRLRPQGAAIVGRPPKSPAPRPAVRGPRRSLDWFVMDSDGTCPEYPVLSAIDRGVTLKVANDELPGLHQEIGGVLPHLVGEDRIRFRLLQILTELGARLPSTTLWVHEPY